ncbi:Periplasmic serine protease [Candidatus Terasakiella magnetica]|nr:Periplasmic serine protease [Candidatus Terasakiella magnetica]
MRRLGRILITLLAFTGLLTLSVLGLGIWASLHFADKAESDLPKRAVLSLDLEAHFHETASGDPLAAFSSERSYTLRSVVEAIDHASSDPRVVGLYATMGHSTLGLAAVQEIRDAVSRFRAAGKPALLFAETIGETGAGTLDYYLASAFGQIWLQPSGDLAMTGLMIESPFIRGTLDLLGIKAQFSARHEYKSAIDMFNERGFTGPNRENLGRLLDSWSEQMASGISAVRALPADKVKALMGQGPFLASEALAAGLVDRVGYRDAAWKAIAGDGKDKALTAEELDVADYAATLPEPKGPVVALISGTGAIHRGESGHGFGSEADFGAKTIAEALRDAIDDDAVRAILFRVDSPGGSYTASDTIWREVQRAREAGKPVVVSMGNVAASGGYFVGMGADRIVAQPGTITGSIGVFTGKVVLEEFWAKLGVNWDEMHRGDNATMWSSNRAFPPGAQARIDALLDHIYGDFTGKASEGRRISVAAMDKLARGRVWTGADAKTSGLVDVLGGWREALAAVRELTGLKPGQEVELVEFPRPKKPWELVAEALAGSQTGMASGLRTLARLEPVVKHLAPLAEPVSGATLRMPPLDVTGTRP